MRDADAHSLPGRMALEVLAREAVHAESRAAGLLTTVVANSTAVAERISRYWNRESTVVHPPVDTEFYTPDPGEPTEDFFLLAGRVVSYRRPDIAIRAAAAAGVRLVVAGSGREDARCRQLAEGNADITFMGRVSDEQFRSLYRRARAAIMPGEEDFGIIPVEAMACGTPVIALGVGGVCDSVVDGLTGTLILPGDDASVIGRFADKFAGFGGRSFDRGAIRRHAEGFSRGEFRRKMADIVGQTVADHHGR